jgi:hypothetical protein
MGAPKMLHRPVAGLTLFYEAGREDAAKLIGGACKRTVEITGSRWGLEPKTGTRVYVMTSWQRVMFHSAPGPRRVVLALTYPLWAARTRRVWEVAGGWEIYHKGRPVAAIKPPDLVAQADWSLGDQLFIREETIEDKVRHVTCHELTHAMTTHLRLPAWLKEGLAMVAVDHYFERPTVLAETLDTLVDQPPPEGQEGQRRIDFRDPEDMIHLYARGYWLTRYLDELKPELLEDLLRQPLAHEALEAQIAAAWEQQPESFWSNIDRKVVNHFG